MWGARILIPDAALRRVASLAGMSSNPRLSKMFANNPISCSSTFSSLDFNYLFVCLFDWRPDYVSVWKSIHLQLINHKKVNGKLATILVASRKRGSIAQR